MLGVYLTVQNLQKPSLYLRTKIKKKVKLNKKNKNKNVISCIKQWFLIINRLSTVDWAQ